MNDAKKISEFVEQVFDLYQADKCDIFSTSDWRTNEKKPLDPFPNGEIDDETLRKISVRIGMTNKEIVNMDMQAARRYWNKYPFFRLYRQYMDDWARHQNSIYEMPSKEEMLLKFMFPHKKADFGGLHYDMESVYDRLIETIKEIDKVIPGTYHDGAEITNLKVSTQIFFSFPQCGDMIKSFIDMVKRTEKLFFSALHGDLSEEDVNELNFLASWLDAVDVVMPSTVITYDTVCTYRNAYLDENSQDFFSYVKIKSFVRTSPWRCHEFFDDIELVREFLYIFPRAKAAMREFVHDVSNFSCFFNWSDASPIRFSEWEEAEFDDYNEMLGLPPLTENERAKEITHVYIKKTPEEMRGWGKFIKQIKVATGPSSRGGIPVPDRKHPASNHEEAIQRIQRRLEAKRGGALNG